MSRGLGDVYKRQEMTRQIQKKALEEGLLLLICGTHGNVIRFLYPLTIPDEQFGRALQILSNVLMNV